MSKFLDVDVLNYSIKTLSKMIDITFLKKKQLFNVTPETYRLFDASNDDPSLKLTVIDNSKKPITGEVTSDTVRSVTKVPSVYAVGAEVVHIDEVLVPKFDSIKGIEEADLEVIKKDTKANRQKEYNSNVLFIIDDKSMEFYDRDKDTFEAISSGGGSSKLTKDLTSNVTVGGINAATTYKKDADIETIIRDLLIKYFPADLVFSLNPSKTLYKIGEVVNSIDLIATVTKKSENIENIKYYIDGALVDTKDETTDPGIVNGGTYTYTHGTPFSTDTTFKVDVYDGKNITTKTIKIEFVNPFYCGLASSTLQEIVQKKDDYTYNNITCNNDSIVFKYPKSYGTLTSILDSNNFENISAFSRNEEVINSVDYYVYTSAVTTVTNFKFIFKF